MPYARCLAAMMLLIPLHALADDAPKKLLLVTHSGGFVHESIVTAERVLKAIGPKNGFEVTCYRFTGDPDATVKITRKDKDGKDSLVETNALDAYNESYLRMLHPNEKNLSPVTQAECGRVNAETLKQFDVVLFFTSSPWFPNSGVHPLTTGELNDLLTWVREGGGFAATHAGSDTLHNTAYGDLVGGTFGGHPWVQKIRVKVEDPAHPAARGLTEGAEIHDEIYQFGAKPDAPNFVPLRIQPYSREKLHIILSVDNSSIDVTKGARPDNDYAISWCQQFGGGRSFYTSLGHFPATWNDERFQQHLIGGLKWAAGVEDGDSTPSGKKN